jgi:hypothetical protein
MCSDGVLHLGECVAVGLLYFGACVYWFLHLGEFLCVGVSYLNEKVGVGFLNPGECVNVELL